MVEIDIKETVQKLNDKLVPSGWYRMLKNFLTSLAMQDIIKGLVAIKERKEFFCPTLLDMFRWLELVPTDKVKVIILYGVHDNNLLSAKGLPMTASNASAVKAKILNTIHREDMNTWPDVLDWYKQGVLVIPVAPSSIADGEGCYDLWKPFIAYLLHKVNEHYSQVPVIMIGRKAIQYNDMINTMYKIPFYLWPTVIDNQAFSRVNKMLTATGQTEIKWV